MQRLFLLRREKFVNYDVIVVGGGASGEAAASLGAELGGKVALVERDLVGGECGFWACMPSKSLLDSASRRAIGAEYSWNRASERRDWMISREQIELIKFLVYLGLLTPGECRRRSL